MGVIEKTIKKRNGRKTKIRNLQAKHVHEKTGNNRAFVYLEKKNTGGWVYSLRPAHSILADEFYLEQLIALKDSESGALN